MSDDSREYSASQSAHAEKLREERNLQNLYGVTHSQARSALHKARADSNFQRFVRANQNGATSQPAPTVKSTETKLEPIKQVFNAAPNAPPPAPAGIPAPTLPSFDIQAITVNGVLILSATVYGIINIEE